MAFRGYRRSSRRAVWSNWATLVAVQLLLLTLVLHRFASLHTPAALALFGLCMIVAIGAIFFAIWSLIQIWDKGYSGARRAFASIILAILVLAGPAFYMPKFLTLPMINDITTDHQAPPSFEVLAQKRSVWANSIIYPGQKFYQLQKVAYPSVRPMTLERSAEEAFDLVRDAVKRLEWDVLVKQAPGKNGASGWIEATDKTLIMGFLDDIVIRVSGDDTAARIDVRSTSRFGRHDLGKNAARINNLFSEIRASLAKGEQQLKIQQEIAQKRAIKLREAEKKRREKAALARKKLEARVRREIRGERAKIKRKRRARKRIFRDIPWDVFEQ